jgi:hypothetical protein
MSGISNDILPWSWNYTDLMKRGFLPAMRLSKSIAVYTDGKGDLQAEYRGRYLGRLNENTISVDDEDFSKPWIKAAVNEVACEMRRA